VKLVLNHPNYIDFWKRNFLVTAYYCIYRWPP